MSPNLWSRSRRVLVTGGTGVLGREVVRAFVSAGGDVHVTWTDPQEAERFEQDRAEEPFSRVTLHRVDLADAEQVASLGATLERAGGVDVLAGLAGAFAYGAIGETPPAVWTGMWAANASSAFFAARAVVPGMQARRWGRIVLVSSVAALGQDAGNKSAYTAAKSAVLGLVSSLSAELVGDEITVNAVLPTVMDTPANRRDMPDADRSRWLPPAEVAGVIAFLASDAARIVTGSSLVLAR